MARKSSDDRIVGPARVGHRSILCRSCARSCSRRVDGTWRHDDDGSILDGQDGRHMNPDQVRELGDELNRKRAEAEPPTGDTK